MQHVRTRPNQKRRAARAVQEEATAIDYKELQWNFQQHWRVITPVWAALPVAFLASWLLTSVLSYSIVFWAFSLAFIGSFALLSYRTYELVLEERISHTHWLLIVWVPWLPVAIVSNAVISFFGRLIIG